MRAFKTEKRLAKIESVLKARQHSLTVVFENIHDPHNVSAMLRTCDAVGVPKVSLIYSIEKFPKISRISSASANKWIVRENFRNVNDCFAALRNNGFKIFASALQDGSKNLYDLDLTKKTAIVLGNEHRGVSKEAAEQADEIFHIPMNGMVQSLNVSVANAVILYEIFRQRLKLGMYPSKELSENEIEKQIDEWCKK